MRVALISALRDDWSDGEPLTLAGRTVPRRQVDLALDLGCQHVACLAQGPSREMVRIQRAAEKRGARFNAITGSRAMAGLIKAADEVLVLAPDTLVDAAFAAKALGGRPGIVTLPADRGVAAGFERMDGDAAWAGVMLLPGAMVDRLADLPADSDPASSLLRIAMQAGTRRILVAPSALDHGELALVRDGAAATRAEKALLDRGMGKAGWRRPASGVVRFVSRLFAPRLLVHDRLVHAMIGVASLLTVGAAAAAWYERATAGLGVLALAAATYLSAHTLRSLESGVATPPARGWTDLAVDAAFVTIAVVASPRNPQVALFAALVAVLALRLARLHGAAAQIAPAGDRVLFVLLAALAAGFGKLVPALEAFSVATLGFELFSRSRSKLTPA